MYLSSVLYIFLGFSVVGLSSSARESLITFEEDIIHTSYNAWAVLVDSFCWSIRAQVPTSPTQNTYSK